MIDLHPGPAVRAVTKATAMPLLGVLAGLGAATAATAVLPTTYEATASVIIMPAGSADSKAPQGADVSLAQTLAPSIARLADSREVATQAAAALGLPVDEVNGHITGVSEPGIQIVTVHASARTAAGATAIANAATEAMRELCARLRLGGESAITVQTLDRAGQPDQPISPRPTLNLALGALVGLLVGLGFASLRTRVDDHFRRVADIEAALGLPALGVLGLKPGRTLRRGPRLIARSEVEKAVDGILAAVSVLSPQRAPRRIVVTSVGDRPSAAAVATLVAAGMSRHHHRTTLVETQPRLASIRRYAPAESERTLDQILVGGRPAPSTLTVLPVAALHGYLRTVTPSGDQVGAVLDALAATGEQSVVSARPVMAGTDLCALTRHADVVLLVVASDQARKADACRAALLVARLGVPLAGLVIIGGAANADGWQPASWPTAEIAPAPTDVVDSSGTAGESSSVNSRTDGFGNQRSPLAWPDSRYAVEALSTSARHDSQAGSSGSNAVGS